MKLTAGRLPPPSPLDQPTVHRRRSRTGQQVVRPLDRSGDRRLATGDRRGRRRHDREFRVTVKRSTPCRSRTCQVSRIPIRSPKVSISVICEFGANQTARVTGSLLWHRRRQRSSSERPSERSETWMRDRAVHISQA